MGTEPQAAVSENSTSSVNLHGLKMGRISMAGKTVQLRCEKARIDLGREGGKAVPWGVFLNEAELKSEELRAR